MKKYLLLLLACVSFETAAANSTDIKSRNLKKILPVVDSFFSSKTFKITESKKTLSYSPLYVNRACAYYEIEVSDSSVDEVTINKLFFCSDTHGAYALLDDSSSTKYYTMGLTGSGSLIMVHRTNLQKETIECQLQNNETTCNYTTDGQLEDFQMIQVD